MEQDIFMVIIEGATEKVSQFVLQLKSVYENNCFHKQKCIFEHCRNFLITEFLF